MRRFLAALLFGLFAASLQANSAAAQGCGQQNPNCVVPTAPPGTSNNQAASTAFVQSAISGSSPGGSSGQIQYNNSGSFGGFTASGDVAINPSTGVATIQPNAVTDSKINPGAANTFKGSLNGTATSDIALTACSLSYQISKWVAGTGWQCGINPVLPSRAIAATLNLSAYSAITTQGYAQPGDGGGASFLNSTTSPFIDSQILTGSISANGTSGCTNATYLGVPLSGGHGTNAQANIVVSGNVATSITIVADNNGYAIGDVLSATVTGCAATVTYTAATLTTPTGSFADTASNHWQITVDAGNYPNSRQFGAKVNWTHAGGDAAATDDTVALQNAINYVGALVAGAGIDSGGLIGGTLIAPKGYSLFTALQLQEGVNFVGVGPNSSGLKVSDSVAASVNPITICDPTIQLACFGSYIGNMEIFPGSATGNANTAVIFSNNIQQSIFASRLWIYAGPGRDCVALTSGFGGAATTGMDDIQCTISTGAAAGVAITLGSSQTLVNLTNLKIEAGGSGLTTTGLSVASGFVDLTTMHTEGISSGIVTNIPANSGWLRAHNISGGAHCTNLITRQAGSVTNQNTVGTLNPNGCTTTINNGGTPITGVQIADQTF